jgi:hypothetical protein
MRNNLTDYIKIFESIIPDELCDTIINEYKESPLWKDALLASAGVLDKATRSNSVIGLPPVKIVDGCETPTDIDRSLFECAGRAIKNYIEIFPNLTIVQDSGYELLRYEIDQHYSQHCDFFLNGGVRSISCSFILNDDYEGGEFGFFDREITHKLSKGSAIMFPSNFMYPHEIMPVTQGTRYSIITWFM